MVWRILLLQPIPSSLASSTSISTESFLLASKYSITNSKLKKKFLYFVGPFYLLTHFSAPRICCLCSVPSLFCVLASFSFQHVTKLLFQGDPFANTNGQFLILPSPPLHSGNSWSLFPFWNIFCTGFSEHSLFPPILSAVLSLTFWLNL